MIKSIKLGKAVIRDLQLYSQLFQQWKEKGCSYSSFVTDIHPILNEDLTNMKKVLEFLSKEDENLTAHILCENAQESLFELTKQRYTENEAINKIIYELIPILDEILNDIYFWGFCYPEKDLVHQYYQLDMDKLCPIPNIKDAKYDLSILIPAYNKLEYTKLCLEFLYKYLPENLSYELILLNHGSSDGTKEYFESIKGAKTINFKRNNKSLSILGRVIEGRYALFLSNDALILPNVIENLLACLTSSKQIACVMPACSNIANYGSIDLYYNSMEELVEVAKENNKSNPKRWIQRSRLNSPVLLARADEKAFYAFLGYQYPFYQERFVAFTDDVMSMVARRSGKKCILAEDSYVHHFGSVTVEKQNTSIYSNGIKAFQKFFDINPWGTGFCYDWSLLNDFYYINGAKQKILGINMGLCDDLFQIKSRLLEKTDCREVSLMHFNNQKRIIDEMKNVLDDTYFYNSIESLCSQINGRKFHYIIGNFTESLSKDVLVFLTNCLEDNGVLILNNLCLNSIDSIENVYTRNSIWTYLCKVNK